MAVSTRIHTYVDTDYRYLHIHINIYTCLYVYIYMHMNMCVDQEIYYLVMTQQPYYIAIKHCDTSHVHQQRCLPRS